MTHAALTTAPATTTKSARFIRCGPLLLVGFADFFKPFLQVVLVLFLQRRILRRAVDLTRLVLALVELLARPFVVNVNDVGVIDDLLHQRRRNEIHTFRVAE